MAKLKLESKEAANTVLIPESQFRRLSNFESQTKTLENTLNNTSSNINYLMDKLQVNQTEIKNLLRLLDSCQNKVRLALIISAFGFGAGILALVKTFIK